MVLQRNLKYRMGEQDLWLRSRPHEGRTNRGRRADMMAGQNVSTPVVETLPTRTTRSAARGFTADVTPAWGEDLPEWVDTLISLVTSGEDWPAGSESGEAARLPHSCCETPC